MLHFRGRFASGGKVTVAKNLLFYFFVDRAYPTHTGFAYEALSGIFSLEYIPQDPMWMADADIVPPDCWQFDWPYIDCHGGGDLDSSLD